MSQIALNPSESEEQIISRAAHKKHMEKKTVVWDIALFFTVSILGVLLHIAGMWFSSIPILAWIAPINESIWEHLKLLLWPACLIALLRKVCTGQLQRGLLTTFAEGILLSMMLTVVGFYTYSGIWGQHSFWADISLFFLSALILTWYVKNRADRQKKSSLPGLIIILLLAGCFIWFSYDPPEIGIFMDLSQSLQ